MARCSHGRAGRMKPCLGRMSSGGIRVSVCVVAQALFEGYDVNRDGTITGEEFVRALVDKSIMPRDQPWATSSARVFAKIRISEGSRWASLPYLSAHTSYSCCSMVTISSYSALRSFWPDWYLRKLSSAHKTMSPGVIAAVFDQSPQGNHLGQRISGVIHNMVNAWVGNNKHAG